MGRRDAELLDFLKLMHAEDAARVTAVRTDLLTEARRNAGVANRQTRLGKPLVTMESGNRLLRRGNQVFLIHLLIFRLLAAFTNDLES